MEKKRQHTISPKVFGLLFHLVLWTTWIGLPIVNAADNQKFQLFAIWLVPGILLCHLPMFLINTELLIPRVLKRRGVGAYLLSLLLLVVAFSAIYFSYKQFIIPAEVRFHRNDLFWSVVPVIFAAAISTGYGFIVYLNSQAQAQAEENEERLRSELSFLRSQISPHFIFNILNSLVYLIRTDTPLAESVTIRLSELMRYMLYSSEDAQVPLADEIDYLSNYIGLQEVRFGEDVAIRFRYEGDPGSHQIEPMILIPFVENAFKHGVGMVAAPVIDIVLSIRGDRLTFEVENKVSGDNRDSKDASSGIGLRNVRRRLELLYPSRHLLDAGERDGWFRVQLALQLAPVRSRPTPLPV